MADLDQLKRKYQPVLDALNEQSAVIEAVDLQGEKLHIKAVCVSQASVNRVWNAIKAVDPTFADLAHEITFHQGDQKYTVKAGDNLGKIAQHFYGAASQSAKIVEANKISDPDKIRVGQELTIPG